MGDLDYVKRITLSVLNNASNSIYYMTDSTSHDITNILFLYITALCNFLFNNSAVLPCPLSTLSDNVAECKCK